MLFSLAWQSLWNRRLSVLLTVLTISVSVMLLLGVEKIRVETRNSFTNTISGTDLVVGARSGPIALMLYSVFRMGDATNNIRWESYNKISKHRSVAWTIPLSLGDSHRGHRVIGTNNNYFSHYKYGRSQALRLAQGHQFSGLFDVVLGAKVAKELDYSLGDKLVIAHGMGNTSFAKHDEMPFTVTGILAPTGTPVDNSLHVSLEAIEAVHVDWQSGAKRPGKSTTAEEVLKMKLEPQQITAMLVGLKSKIATFKVQRAINNYSGEPLLAVLPGVALQQMWQMIAVVEQALLAISVLVVVSGVIGMLTVLLASLNERRREMAVLRSVGASPSNIMWLLVLESFAVLLIAELLAVVLVYVGLLIAQPLLADYIGVQITISFLSLGQLQLLSAILVAGTLVGLIPGYRAYRNSLADGLTIRL